MFRQKISLGVGKSVISGASLSSSWPDIANSNRSTRKRRKVSGKLLVKSSFGIVMAMKAPAVSATTAATLHSLCHAITSCIMGHMAIQGTESFCTYQ